MVVDPSTVHFLPYLFTLQAYQCDVCDFDKLQQTFLQIESDFKTHISGVVAVRSRYFWVGSLLIRVLERWNLRCQARIGVVSRGFPEDLRCQCLRRLQHLPCSCQVCYIFFGSYSVDMDSFYRLWTGRAQEGSIVITASMSAQIINQASRNQALTQVCVAFLPWKSPDAKYCERHSTIRPRPRSAISERHLPLSGPRSAFE